MHADLFWLSIKDCINHLLPVCPHHHCWRRWCSDTIQLRFSIEQWVQVMAGIVGGLRSTVTEVMGKGPRPRSHDWMARLLRETGPRLLSQKTRVKHGRLTRTSWTELTVPEQTSYTQGNDNDDHRIMIIIMRRRILQCVSEDSWAVRMGMTACACVSTYCMCLILLKVSFFPNIRIKLTS